jgi:crotonobetainyl-CoA:carnitine CoA-transferase CaiB-like acyl-CoA transferase
MSVGDGTVTTGSRGGLLDGLRVIDLSLWQPGHTATQLLADLGADVLKVEPPGGDRMRFLPDRFANYNAGKRSVCLDLKQPADRQRCLDLIADAEVVVENFRPGVADRLGVGFDQLTSVNPSIVMCSITGFGQSGDLSGMPGHDHNFQAFAGAFTFPSDGGAPSPAGLLVGDQGAGMAAAFAILAAVLCARRTGEPEHIDLSITDLLASWVAPMGSIDATEDRGLDAADLPGMGVFATADGGYVELGVFTENQLWDALCDSLGLGQHIGLSMAERTTQAAALRADLVAAIVQWSRDELVDSLGAHGVPASPVRSREEMLDHPYFASRGVIVRGPTGRRMVAHPIRYRNHPARPLRPAPTLGVSG